MPMITIIKEQQFGTTEIDIDEVSIEDSERDNCKKIKLSNEFILMLADGIRQKLGVEQ